MTTYKVVVYKGEDGYVVVECPELPGCISQGKTKTEALRNIKEAIELYIETAREHKQTLPKVEFLDVSIPA